MTCACKDSKATPRSDSQLNYEQEQYLVDLLNRDYSEEGERTDAAQMKCKVGKPCNGRCIPQNHKCGAPGGMRSGMGSNLGKGLAAGATGLALAGAATFAHSAINRAGGYKSVANTGLNAAESGIRGANNAVQSRVGEVSEGIRAVHGKAQGGLNKVAQIAANRSANTGASSAKEEFQIKKGAGQIQASVAKVKGSTTKAARSLNNAVATVGVKSQKAANKSQAFVRALRKKVNG